jgi:hypothetical protein
MAKKLIDTYDVDSGVETLGPLLREGKLIVLTGSGVSVPSPSNLPTWDGFLREFIKFCRLVQEHAELDPADRFDELLSDAEAEAAKYPIRVASALKQKLLEIERKYAANISNLMSLWLTDLFQSGRWNANHEQIVETNYKFILTSNYDRLLELAARDLGHWALYANTYSFKEPEKIAGVIYSEKPAIIHVHGDVRSISLEDFIFTSEDYLRIRRSYPGFTLSVQSLMLNYSVLFVGYGGSDPHLEELVEELRFFFRYSDSELLPRCFILLKKGKASKVLKQFKTRMRTSFIEIDNYEDTPLFLKYLRAVSPRHRPDPTEATADAARRDADQPERGQADDATLPRKDP